MSAKKFPVVIVGGGPAGYSAAHVLALAGIKTCLIDAATFPRDKLCGGLLTLRSKKVFQRVFQADWSPVIQAVSNGAAFYCRTRLLRAVEDYRELSFTCRKDFDAFLLNRARHAGAQILEGDRVASVDPGRSSLALSSGERFDYDYLIGADGVNSLVAKALFARSFNPRTIAFGLEMEVPISTACPPIAAPEIYFGLIDWGYAWVFPKGATLTAGIGGRWRGNAGLPATFKRFLCQRFGQLPPAPIKGHHVPFGDFRPTPGHGRILLCGDAAGLVDPITGEGIAFAMQSGALAAEAIKHAVLTGQAALVLQFYQESYASLASNFRRANTLRYFLFPRFAQFLFAKVLARSESLPKRHMDLMADEISYADYRRSLFRGLLRTLPGAWARLHPRQ